MLGHVGAKMANEIGKMAIKSARMSQHRCQGANPRGFEGLAGAHDGREDPELGVYIAFA